MFYLKTLTIPYSRNNIEACWFVNIIYLKIQIGCFNNPFHLGTPNKVFWISPLTGSSGFHLHKYNEFFILHHNVYFMTIHPPILLYHFVSFCFQKVCCCYFSLLSKFIVLCHCA